MFPHICSEVQSIVLSNIATLSAERPVSIIISGILQFDWYLLFNAIQVVKAVKK